MRTARIALVLLVSQGACAPDLPEGCDALADPGDNDDNSVQTMLLDVRKGDTACLGVGTFNLTRELTLSTDNVTVRGAGQDITILEFGGQDFGATAMRLSGHDITVEGFTLQNSPGDGIFVRGKENIVYRNVTVRWEQLQGEENGAYALYPVQMDGVTVQGCKVVGSRDAGVYVGQSRNILVEDSVAHDNVIGVEIENSFDAVVRNNEMYNNSGGILVSNLAGLPQQNGERTLIHGNDVHNNNVPNWAEAGTSVSEIPAGTGIIVVASDYSEIRDNVLHHNRSFAVALVSYLLIDPLGGFVAKYPEFDGYAEGNYVHHNTVWENGADPDEAAQALEPAIPVPPLVSDGCPNPAHDPGDQRLTNCWADNNEQGGVPAAFFFSDRCGMPPAPHTDLAPYACTHDELPDPGA